MKKASELIAGMSEGQQSETTSKNESEKLSDKWVLAIFKRFDDIYPGQWKDRYETVEQVDAGLNEWGEALFGFTGDQIKAGIENCRKNLSWPPTIAQFIKQALGDNQGLSHNTAAYKVFQKALPKPKSDGKAANTFFQNFKSNQKTKEVKDKVQDSLDTFHGVDKE